MGEFTSYYSLLFIDAAQLFTHPLLDSMDRHVCHMQLVLGFVYFEFELMRTLLR